MWGSVAVLALPIAFDPVRLGVNLLLISRPRPAQNLLVYWVGCVAASVMLLLLPLLALHVTDVAWVHDLANPRTTASATRTAGARNGAPGARWSAATRCRISRC